MIEFKATVPLRKAPQAAPPSTVTLHAAKTVKPAAQAPMPVVDDCVQPKLPLMPEPKGEKTAP